MNQFYTYLHCRPDGIPFYVGKGCAGRGHSRRSHDFKQNRNQHHRNIVAKHGYENILVYVFPCDSEQQSLADEIQQISQLRRDGYDLCNMTDGGEGISGHQHTIEMRAKIGAASKGNKYALGYRHSSEARAKISAAGVGRKVLVGKKQSLESIAKRSASLMGRLSGMLGKKHSEETKKKMSEAKKGKPHPTTKGKPWTKARRAAQNKIKGNKN